MSRDVRPRIFDEDGSTISQSNIGEYINRHVTLDQGYKVLVRRYRATNQKKLTKTNANATIGLRCWRGRKSESTKGANKTESNTKLSQEDDDVCDWFIPAYYDAEDDVVYFKQHCNACFEHNGHPHIKREHMKLGASDIPERRQGKQLKVYLERIVLHLLYNCCSQSCLVIESLKTQLRKCVGQFLYLNTIRKLESLRQILY